MLEAASASFRARMTRGDSGEWGLKVKNMGGTDDDELTPPPLLLLLLLLLLQLRSTSATCCVTCVAMALHAPASSSSVRHVISCDENNCWACVGGFVTERR